MRLSRAFAITGLIVVVAAAAAFATARLTYRRVGQVSVDVVLTMQAGACRAVEPGLLGGSEGARITWNVRNIDCDAAQFIEFKDYRKATSDGGLGQPEKGIVAPDPTPASGPVARGATQLVNATIAKKMYFFDEIYKYSICVGPSAQQMNNCTDPYIDVWP
jgi:hypothetical protein